MALILCTLGEEQETLACLGGMRSVAVSDICLVVVKVTRQMLVLERFVTEPEELLRDEKAPVQKIVQWIFSPLGGTYKFTSPIQVLDS